ncbi:MAG: DUF2304 domain-containing protein [Erysipelotrichaceae bacterium]|uniref:DUF2304 domain-containing protein n=1 Tax=Grylomicrobium aquisgranensis TaxID=2926318 RepID=A0AB35U577_9FIRM|nr:DUF2304 domain-containing protein [Erysipelotrichaceae bacterium]MCH4044073.1 DUF2304 domain-containing protein [Erysipelotrichaceae bacterium]MCH4121288.1 DUF2304 domain-containing protein [Erysipelotrichaceae bacterium]MDX8419944.1 DUF2304 domain-containing protein [Stecheria sp. CLA-KB-P133]
MSTKLRLVLLVLLLIAFVMLIKQIKNGKLLLKYSLSWMFLLIGLTIFLLFPGLLGWITRGMGVQLPINMVFFLGFLFMILIVYRLTEAISLQSIEIKELAQKIALLEKENRKNRKE